VFIDHSRWRFAKTMRRFPHYYTLRDEAPDEEMFVRFVLHIRKHGYKKKFLANTYIYFDLDGWCYWTMGCPIGPMGRGNYNSRDHTILINRAQLVPNPSAGEES
jgi:hypothetical protein